MNLFQYLTVPVDLFKLWVQRRIDSRQKRLEMYARLRSCLLDMQITKVTGKDENITTTSTGIDFGQPVPTVMKRMREVTDACPLYVDVKLFDLFQQAERSWYDTLMAKGIDAFSVPRDMTHEEDELFHYIYEEHKELRGKPWALSSTPLKWAP